MPVDAGDMGDILDTVMIIAWIVFGPIMGFVAWRYYVVTSVLFPGQAAVAFVLMLIGVGLTVGLPVWYYVLRPLSKLNDYLDEVQ